MRPYKVTILHSYLIFVIFLHEQNFWRIKFTPKKRVNYDKIHRKLPIFLRYYGKIHSKLPIFCVKSVKIYTSQKKIYTRILVALVTNMRYDVDKLFLYRMTIKICIENPSTLRTVRKRINQNWCIWIKGD